MTPLLLPPLAAGYLLTNAFICPAMPAPAVTTDFKNNPPTYKNDLSSKQLGSFTISTKFSHGPKEVFSTGGVTMGNISVNYEINFFQAQNAATEEFCLGVKDVAVTIDYSPDVYIASESKPGTCRYDTTLQHEIRHVNTDVLTLQEYVPLLQKAVADAAGNLPVTGPVNKKGLYVGQKQASDAVKSAVDAVVERLYSVRLARQQLIDTRQEYLRLSKVCP